MAQEIIWTAEAEKTFEQVIEYLQQQWSDKEVAKFVEKVIEVTEHISRHPFAYRSAGKEDVREAVITKQNILLYRIAGKRVYLLYFWDTRKNPARKPGAK
jgi:plasmid stabilization system protein ParE